MIKDGSSIPTGTVLSTQVCIIGSGQAGVTAAWQLQAAGIKVILLEGSRTYDTYQESWPDKVVLYNGESVGLFATNEREFLILPYGHPSHQPASERERFYGGTSNHWGGQCRPEDPIDLEERPGFPGWPVTRAELDPYYAQASAFMNLHGDYNTNGENFSAEYWAGVLGACVPVLDGFDVEMYQFVGGSYRNFGTRTFDGQGTIGDSPVEVIRNATVLNIDHQQGGVTKLDVASMDTDTSKPPKKATEFTVKADLYVLACGAVANARQLLLANAGNEHDLVGRYFMCHPLSRNDVITSTLSLSQQEGMLMSGQSAPGVPWTDSNSVTVEGRFIPNAEETRKLKIGRCWFWYSGSARYYFEMAPNPCSRVTLSDKVDCVFRQPQTKIDWQLSAQDGETYKQTIKLFRAAVSNHPNGGTVTFPSWDDLKSQLTVNGHHIGTTRMSREPEQGVVDPNLKVHSLNNLYVAGSSVFPTAAISNPTFTIITLSIRLASHLTKVLGNGG